MTIFNMKLLALVIALSLSVPALSYAEGHLNQDDTDTTYTEGEYDELPDIPDWDPGFDRDGGVIAVPPGGAGITPATNQTVISAIRSATAYCSPMKPREYVIDCLSERLGELSKQLQGQEGFEEVQAVLQTTSGKLNDIVRKNRSTTLAPARFATPGPSPVRTTRRLVPVDEAKLDEAVAEALVVIEEAETLLLRSAGQATDRSIQYQRIAAAIGSNKVLLRSL